MTRFRVLLVLGLAPAMAGCVMPDQMARLEKDVADVQQEVTAVSKAQGEITKKVSDLEGKLGGGDVVKRSDIADLGARLDEVVKQSTATSDKVDQVNARVDRLSQDVQAARDSARRAAGLQPPGGAAPAAGGPDGATVLGAAAAAGIVAGAADPSKASPPPSSAANPNALYTTAYADFSKGNYPLAIQGFEEFATSFPDADLADNALYWVGECHFSQGAFKAAVDDFDTMLAKYPKSDKAAAANLKKALAFLQLNQVGQGIEQLRFVVASYPGSDEARIAKDRLATLGKP